MKEPFSPPFTELFQKLKNGARQFDAEQLIQAPIWMQHAVQARLVLIVNHVLQQDQRAIDQLLPHQGKTVQAQWRQFIICLRITPAGLVALEPNNQAVADLNIQVNDTNPLNLIHQAMLGKRPKIHIYGDAELASSIHWLVANLRWNAQEDVAQLLGAETAAQLAKAMRLLRNVLEEFINTVTGKVKPNQPTELPHHPPTDKP